MTEQIQLNKFWADAATRYVSWMSPWKTVQQGGFEQGDVQWFVEGKLNVSVNCLDRHLPTKANQVAILWEGDNEEDKQSLTYAALYQDVCRMANVLKTLGIKKGDTVAIYLPMIPEAAISMLACARIGAVHTVIFAGFSAQALGQRIKASSCKLLITADGYQRGGKTFALKQNADEASLGLDLKTLVIKHNNNPVPFNARSNYWWHTLKQNVSPHCEPEAMDAEDPLFILYTSGSTGQPKGLVHTTGGYLVQVAQSHHHIFNCKANEVFWCTADVGWITGHSYVVYAPLCNGITTLMFGGIPTWPDAARCWRMIDKYFVNVFYTAPTAIRALKRAGDEWLSTTSRKSLRLLGTVGEPINPEVWEWYQQSVGLGQTEVVDTWWQTETGAIMLSPQMNHKSVKPGAACQPLPGIFPVLLDDDGKELNDTAEGALAIKYPWPAMARTIAGDHTRYRNTYLKNGYYLSGDGALRDKDGDYWISGRIDDVLNVSGHRLGTAEIESALLTHDHIAEAAVIGVPHPVKGLAIHAFVSLKRGKHIHEALNKELLEAVTVSIGAIARPEVIQIIHDLPKTRSGKIMRRILRMISCQHIESLEELGDLSTLANPEVVEELIIVSNARQVALP